MQTQQINTANQLVNITPAAITRLKLLMAKQNRPGLMLRLGVKGGGCSGLSYTMTFDETSSDKDHQFEQDGITILVDPKSARFLEGVQLDFTTANLLEGGWKWSNPNAQRSCGCGTSFTPK
jgi:iron-sulfur cluster assembly protein